MDFRDRFSSARTFDEFLATVEKNVDLWQAITRRADVPADFVRRVEATGKGWRLLVMAEDWCGDAVHTVPLVAKLAAAAANAEVRIVGRDDNPELMDTHLTGTSRSIPVVIVLDDAFTEHAWWAPRPAPLQQWVLGPGQALDKTERYREIRRWYAADRGVTTLTEIVELIEGAAQRRGS